MTTTATLVRRLNLAIPAHRGIANKLAGLDQALALDLPTEARASIEKARAEAEVEVERLVIAHAATIAAAPRFLYDHHGVRVGRA